VEEKDVLNDFDVASFWKASDAMMLSPRSDSRLPRADIAEAET
jgi:hypothetical protein